MEVNAEVGRLSGCQGQADAGRAGGVRRPNIWMAVLHPSNQHKGSHSVNVSALYAQQPHSMTEVGIKERQRSGAKVWVQGERSPLSRGWVGVPALGVGSEVASHREAFELFFAGAAAESQSTAAVSARHEQDLENPSYGNVNGEKRNVALVLLQAEARLVEETTWRDGDPRAFNFFKNHFVTMGPTSESPQFTRSSKRLQKQREEAAGPSKVTRTSRQQRKQREEAAGPSQVTRTSRQQQKQREEVAGPSHASQVTRTSRQQQKQRQEAEPQGAVPVAPVATTSIANRTITLSCWIFEKSYDSFLVEIEDNKSVGHLKEAILRRRTVALEGIGDDQLVLWKASSFLDVDYFMLPTPSRYPFQIKISQMRAFEKVYLKAGYRTLPCCRGFSHIRNPLRSASTLSLTSGLSSANVRKKVVLHPKSSEVERLRKDFAKVAPSSLALPAMFKTISGPDCTVACNLPFERSLSYSMKRLQSSWTDAEWRLQRRHSFASRNSPVPRAIGTILEVQRRTKIRAVLEIRMGVSLVKQKIPGTEFVTAGNLAAIIVPAAMQERARPRSLLGFYGAVWDGDQVRAEPLTPVFDLSIHWRERSARHAIPSALDALVAAVNNIEAHYKSIEAAANANPAPMDFQAFKYNERLDDEKLIFSATINQGDECLVKFTGQYSEAAHRYMASHGLAPKLRWCVQISAEWTMVIMDRSTYKRLHGLGFSPEVQEKVRRKVNDAVQLLHNGQFVHGDIRDVNILVGHLAPEVAIHLVDFDCREYWSGRLPN
ncbi:hypothetical protein BC826DRAFT_967959 [Russula brevipes]|nr:hypothetical protein BC826DRAFT_967959 [Russula brevipes]